MLRLIGMFGLILLLQACASVTPPAPPTAPVTSTPPKDRAVALNNIRSWQIRGKLAYKTAQDAGSATVNWRQVGSRYDIALLGPLGGHDVTLQGSPQIVTLQTSDGKHYSAQNAEQLLAKELGWNLPVSNLRYWIRGLPAPGAKTNTRFDAAGRLLSLTQGNWEVQFLNYTQVGAIDLPSRLNIDSNALKVKIIVYRWLSVGA